MRPAWSVGTAYSPLVWHIRQLSRPSSVCGIAVGSAGGGGGGGSSSADGPPSAGGGDDPSAGAVPPQEIVSNASPSSSTTIPNINFLFIRFCLLLIIVRLS